MSYNIIDLSHTLQENMIVYPDSPNPVLDPVATIESNGYNELRITCSTHTGTHIDAPSHILEKGKNLDELNIDTFYGNALVIDCSHQKSIEEACIEDSLTDYSYFHFLLFYTGWDRYWNTPEYFRNYPVLSSEAAGFISRLHLKGVGIDAPSYDPVISTDLPNHHILLKSGIILIENLCGLQRIPSGEFIFSCFPLKIDRSDASPVRAVAIIA